MNNKYRMNSDGAARGFSDNSNNKRGSFGCVLADWSGETLMECKMAFNNVTNNQCEVMGCIFGCLTLLRSFTRRNILYKGSGTIEIEIASDSQMVIKAIEEWMTSWKKRGWKKAGGGAPKNLELYKILDRILNISPSVKFSTHWNRGHQVEGDEDYEEVYTVFNVRCDELADIALTEKSSKEYEDFNDLINRVDKALLEMENVLK